MTGTTSIAARAAQLGHGDVLKISLPIVLSNATVPMVGFVDTAVIGQLDQPHLMGAVAVSAVIFNLLYWSFSSFAWARQGSRRNRFGAGEHREIAGHLMRALLVAVAAGLLLIVLQRPLRGLSFWLTGGSPDVIMAGHTYFNIRIWAVPAGLVNFAILGWLIGLGRAGTAFMLQVVLNLINMVLAIVFTLWLDFGIAGVGAAALISEVTAAAGAGLFTARTILAEFGAKARWEDAIDRRQLARAFAINSDITVRTMATFTTLLSLYQSGRCSRRCDACRKRPAPQHQEHCDLPARWLCLRGGNPGRARRWRTRPHCIPSCDQVVDDLGRRVRGAGGAAGLVRGALDDRLEHQERGGSNCRRSLPRLGRFAPFLGVWCFQLDGIFVGATRTRDMRNMMLVSLACFFAACAVLLRGSAITGFGHRTWSFTWRGRSR